jgi:hypothetical protein
MLELPKKLPAGASLCVLGLLTVIFYGCGGGGGSSSPATSAVERAKVESAEATLHPIASSNATGTVVLVKKPQGYMLTLEARRLAPTHGANQYALWQLQDPQVRVALQAPEEMVMLATYRVGASGRLSVEFEPPLRAYEAIPNGRLTHFLITRIDSPERLQDSIVQFDETGKPPDLGRPIAEGTFSGPLVGAAERR